MDTFRSIFDWGGPMVVAVATWFIVQFAARPYLRFRTLRTNVQTHLLTLETSFFIFLSKPDIGRFQLIEMQNAEIDKATRALRETGIALIAMADTEWLLSSLLTALGYDPRWAGGMLVSLPVLVGKRSWDELSPPIDDSGDTIIDGVRRSLRLPKVKLLS